MGDIGEGNRELGWLTSNRDALGIYTKTYEHSRSRREGAADPTSGDVTSRDQEQTKCDDQSDVEKAYDAWCGRE